MHIKFKQAHIPQGSDHASISRPIVATIQTDLCNVSVTYLHFHQLSIVSFASSGLIDK